MLLRHCPGPIVPLLLVLKTIRQQRHEQGGAGHPLVEETRQVDHHHYLLVDVVQDYPRHKLGSVLVVVQQAQALADALSMIETSNHDEGGHH